MFTEQKLFIFPYVLHTLLDLAGCQWWARIELEVINKIKIIETLHSDLLPVTNWLSRIVFCFCFAYNVIQDPIMQSDLISGLKLLSVSCYCSSSSYCFPFSTT